MVQHDARFGVSNKDTGQSIKGCIFDEGFVHKSISVGVLGGESFG
jgi:hypothetical protein